MSYGGVEKRRRKCLVAVSKRPLSPKTPTRSRRLFNAGFNTLADVLKCMQAVIPDLLAERISLPKANKINRATRK